MLKVGDRVRLNIEVILEDGMMDQDEIEWIKANKDKIFTIDEVYTDKENNISYFFKESEYNFLWAIGFSEKELILVC